MASGWRQGRGAFTGSSPCTSCSHQHPKASPSPGPKGPTQLNPAPWVVRVPPPSLQQQVTWPQVTFKHMWGSSQSKMLAKQFYHLLEMSRVLLEFPSAVQLALWTEAREGPGSEGTLRPLLQGPGQGDPDPKDASDTETHSCLLLTFKNLIKTVPGTLGQVDVSAISMAFGLTSGVNQSASQLIFHNQTRHGHSPGK